MNHSQLEKLLSTFGSAANPPIVTSDLQKQTAHLATFAEVAKSIGVSSHTSDWGKHQTLVIELGRDGHGTGYRGYRQLYVFFNPEHVLQISASYGGSGTLLRTTEQFSAALQEIVRRLTLEYQQQQRRDKIRNLKRLAIESQVAALARRLGFGYTFERMHTKVKVYIRLNQRDTIAVDIPHNAIQTSVDQIEPLLNVAQEMVKVGLRFQMTQTSYIRHFTEPDSPPDLSDQDEEEADDFT